MTGIPIAPGEGIWDDGEWVSWDFLNGQIYEIDEGEMLERMITMAREYLALTGRHLPIYGEIGELYAARKFGIERHKEYAQGSDGRIGDLLVEIKTLTPMKESDQVLVKRAGNFGAVALVKIGRDFRLEAKLIPRSALGKGEGKFMKVYWSVAYPDFKPSPW